MKVAPVEVVQVALLAAGVVLWIVALVRGRALEWFDGRPALPGWMVTNSEFLAFVAAYLLVTLTMPSLAAELWSLDIDTDPPPVRTALVLGYAVQLGWLGVCAAFFLPRHLRPPAGTMGWAPAALAGIGGLMLFFPAGAAVGQLWKWLLPRLGLSDTLQESVLYLRNLSGVGEFAAWFGMVVILAPLAEECVFRRVLYRYLAVHFPEWTAIGVSAVVFALLHRNAASFLPLVALGVALCLAYRYTGRLITTVVMHAAFNLNSLVYVVLSRET